MKKQRFGLTICLMLTACSADLSVENDVNCDLDDDYTLIQNSGYEIKVFGPNDTLNPDIWQGPICIRDMEKLNQCYKDYSLISGVEIDSKEGIANIQVFSGSTSTLKRLNIATCEAL